MLLLARPRAKVGKALLWFAWVLQIGAATGGLAFVWLFLTRTAIEVGYVDIALATLFVLAAELTKIPLVTAFYFSPSRVRRYLFGFTWLYVSLITLDGSFAGLQAAASPRYMNETILI